MVVEGDIRKREGNLIPLGKAQISRTEWAEAIAVGCAGPPESREAKNTGEVPQEPAPEAAGRLVMQGSCQAQVHR